ncbi:MULTISPECIES: hypothetical protein [unclassified Sinorhizobium]|uniref:hypothetical protein n=1 Tax=unclassified Sinorhizobium TaxID=2613772 RepID=UPI0024C3235F|nr:MULTISPECIES: hypothetical protein [unclassified Sinorhizobium]MDK1373282.1 hypothetical protein [Sinorhizobium sp. 6-70]MDK1479118.1 hypothetical protein [Sinorhizobium sp. 6-117]
MIDFSRDAACTADGLSLPSGRARDACRRPPRLALQKEVARNERLDPGKLDLEVGAAVAGDVAVDDRLVVGGTGGVEGLVDQLSGLARERARTTPGEGLIAREADAVLTLPTVGGGGSIPRGMWNQKRSANAFRVLRA